LLQQKEEKPDTGKKPEKKRPKQKILILESTDPGHRLVFRINQDQFILGRRKSSVDGVISFDDTLSRVHCKIVRKDGAFFVKDLNSTGGTFVNGRRIKAEEEAELKPKDILKLAHSPFYVSIKEA
ncbi:MAG: FHA domain-containing protein, partial [Mogibacterium sp.]|nr:FHA domain-containing protein [Mogibacterium sp.]